MIVVGGVVVVAVTVVVVVVDDVVVVVVVSFFLRSWAMSLLFLCSLLAIKNQQQTLKYSLQFGPR